MLSKPQHCIGCILSCAPLGTMNGYVPASGTGKNGVLVVAEAAGESEASEGKPLVGKSGYALWQQLKRVDIDREDFIVHNVLSCRPPDNKLVKMSYEHAAIEHCSPLLDSTIMDAKAVAKANGKTFVIVTLGVTAFKRVMGFDYKKDRDLLSKDYWGYPFWSDTYSAWVYAAPHPAFLGRGNTHLWPVVQFVFTRALEVATNGLKLDEPDYLLDPTPALFDGWIDGYARSLDDDPGNPLSYDIETPYKKKVKDEEEIGKDESADHTILRISFSYRDMVGNTHTTSVKWSAEYMAGIERLFDLANFVLGWNCPTPDQRVLTKDLRWVRAGDLTVGDELIGLDENVLGNHRIRRTKPSRVLATGRGRARVLAITFSDNSTVKVTEEHPWLLSQRARKGGATTSAWVKTRDLIIGQKIQRMFNVWEEDTTKEAGYLAGFFDGEGYVTGAANGTIRIGAAQNNGVALNHVLATLDSKGFLSKKKYAQREKDKTCCNFVIDGGIGPCAEFLGSTRPVRLLDKFKPEMLGPVWRPRQEPLEITKIEDLGQQEIVRLSTSSKTYFLEGFAAHNSDKYDYPRVSRYVRIRGIGLDGMVAWHILNSSLFKRLGFVTPFYWQNTLVWKYLADKDPALYNAKDALAALICWFGIKRDLENGKLWGVYERGWIELSKALKYMTGVGVLRDNKMRDDAEAQMSSLLDGIEARMEEAVPQEARDVKIYKKAPSDLEGIFEIVKEFPHIYCAVCGIDKKGIKWKGHVKCGSDKTTIFMEPQTVWGKPLAFKISKKRMSSYQLSLKHQAIMDRKEKKVTYDADAISLLVKKYPNDKLYPTILQHRKVSKLLNTYIGTTNENGTLRGGMPIGLDGRIHTQYGRDANTLRFTSEDPNLQNLPRPNPNDPNDLCNIIRNLIVAGPGSILGATDFAGIEAVLVGYFALYPEYIRLALRDVHTYLTVYAIHETDGRVKTCDLPELSWPDDRLFPYLAQLKKEFATERNKLYKHIGHAFNFGQSPKGTQAKVFSETGVEYPLKTFEKLQDIYFSLFPKIRTWQRNVTEEAEKDGYLRNPFDYVARFSKVFDYKKEFGEWIKKAGPDWNKAIAYKPQSTAVGIITESILELFFNRFEEAGQYLRLQVHDELLYETPKEKLDNVRSIVENVMGSPVPQLRLPASWGMGETLAIKTESKQGFRWGEMK